MGFYIELHCDNEQCTSGCREQGPQGGDRRQVAREARRGGWVKFGLRWLCPQCADLEPQLKWRKEHQ